MKYSLIIIFFVTQTVQAELLDLTQKTSSYKGITIVPTIEVFSLSGKRELLDPDREKPMKGIVGFLGMKEPERIVELSVIQTDQTVLDLKKTEDVETLSCIAQQENEIKKVMDQIKPFLTKLGISQVHVNARYSESKVGEASMIHFENCIKDFYVGSTFGKDIEKLERKIEIAKSFNGEITQTRYSPTAPIHCEDPKHNYLDRVEIYPIATRENKRRDNFPGKPSESYVTFNAFLEMPKSKGGKRNCQITEGEKIINFLKKQSDEAVFEDSGKNLNEILKNIKSAGSAPSSNSLQEKGVRDSSRGTSKALDSNSDTKTTGSTSTSSK